MSPTLFETAVSKGASDIHAVSGRAAMIRVDGLLKPLGEELSAKKVTELIRTFLSEAQYKRFLSEKDLDCSHVLPNGVRLRINCHVVSGEPAFAARIIPSKIPSLQAIGMPDVVMDLARSRDGLLLFTGPTGSGKSTSLAAITAQLLTESPLNVITLEDPIEFQLPAGKGLTQQRELGMDFPSFPEGLKHCTPSGSGYRDGRRDARSRIDRTRSHARGNRSSRACDTPYAEYGADHRSYRRCLSSTPAVAGQDAALGVAPRCHCPKIAPKEGRRSYRKQGDSGENSGCLEHHPRESIG